MKKVCLLLVLWSLLFGLSYAGDTKIDFSAIDEFISKDSSVELVSFDLKDVPLSTVLKILAKKSGVNLILDASLEDRIVSVYMEDVGIKEAIKMLVKSQGLAIEQEGDSNLFIVKKKTKSDLVVKVFYLKYATVPGAKILEQASSDSDEEDDSSAEGGLSGKSLFAAVESALSERGTAICDPRTNSIIVKDIPENIKEISNIIKHLDVEVPQVTIEVDMLDVSKTVLDNLGVEWDENSIFYNGGVRSTSFPSSYSKFSAAKRADTLPSIGWTDFTLHALLTDKHTRYLARPKIFTLSGETANIKIISDQVVGLVVNESDAGNLTEEAERHKTGISLNVTPYVNLNTKQITMVINPKIIEAKDSEVQSAIGNTYKDPEERGLKSVVTIPDGETIILGGLIKRRKSSEKTKIPFLGDLLAPLFSSKSTDNIDRELIIFITPRILNDFKDLRKDDSVAAQNRIKTIKGELDKFSSQ